MTLALTDPITPVHQWSDAEWLHKPERGSRFLLRLMLWISKRMGRRAAHMVLRLIAAYFLCFAPVARYGSRLYLARILRRPVRIRDLYRHFLTFAVTIHDRVYLLGDEVSSFTIQSHLSKEMEHAIVEARGALLVGAHLGSFEVLRSVGQQYPGLSIVAVMYEENARKINTALSRIKATTPPQVIPLGRPDTMLRVQEQLGKGALVGFLGDRSVGSERKQPIRFLGDMAHWPSGTFRIAAILQRPLFFMAGLYTGPGKYEIFLKQIADFTAVEPAGREEAIRNAMINYVKEVEYHCHLAPYNWFNFYDFWS